MHIAIEKSYKNVERPFLAGIFGNKMIALFLIIIAILFAVFIISISTDVFEYWGNKGISSFFDFALDYMLKLMGMRG